ncbi:MAG: ABC transporter permease [Cyclobacteriaceae bacterium]|nr:ABC transporter permease [Cyclobacteriaceae bacterium]
MKKAPPPERALKFLRWFCRDDYLEEIEGNLIEIFEDQYAASPHRAGWKFTWNVMLHFRPVFIKSYKTQWSLNSSNSDMLKNYLLIGWRNMLKNKLVSAVNLAGLSMGFTAAIFIALYVTGELNFDRYHTAADRIYRITKTVQTDQGERHMARAAARIAPAAVENLPAVQQAVRIAVFGRLTAGYGTFRDYEPMIAVDSNFFQVFDCRFIAGDPEIALDEPHSVVLTERLAEKYFGDEPPLGKILFTNWFEATVTGVIGDFPSNSHLDPPMLFSLSTMNTISGEFKNYMENDWASSRFSTYLLLEEEARPETVATQINDLSRKHLPADHQQVSYSLQPLKDIHFYSGDLESDYNAHKGQMAYVYIFSAIGFLILFIAFINYINLSTAGGMKRLKEIGLRKTIGAGRNQLVFQFMGESMVMVILTLVLAMAMIYLLMPAFNTLSGKNLQPDLTGGTALLIILVTGLLSAVLAGGYPAFYLSRLKPSLILKNTSGLHGKNPAGQLLLVVQFSIAIVMIAATIVINRQMNFIRNKDLGYNRNQLVTVDINSQPMRQQYEGVKASFLGIPGVEKVTTSTRVPGEWKNLHSATVIHENSPAELHYVAADEDYLPTYEITLLEGRNFSHAAADSLKILINQEAVKVLGLKDPVGQFLEISGFMREELEKPVLVEVIGVIRDLHFQSVREKIMPLMVSYYLNPFYPIDYYTLRIDTRDLPETLAAIRGVTQQFDPENPLEYHFLDEKFEELYSNDTKRSDLFGLAAILGIFIACIGLFGLTKIMVEKSVKEIGIRKVLGAGVLNITWLISGKFLRLIGIAFLIGTPVAWWVTRGWISGFAYHTPVTLDMLLMAGFIVLVISILTVSIQTIHAAKANPVQSLRDE